MYRFFVIICICFLLLGCDSDKKEIIPGLEDIPLSYEIVRFEDFLYSMDTSNLYEALLPIEQQYPVFSQIFFTQILATQDAKFQQDFYDEIKKIIRTPQFKNVFDTVKQVFPNTNTFKAELDDSYRRYKHYFPGEVEPNVFTFMSYYRYQSFIFQGKKRDGVGLGLDLFLAPGIDYKLLDPTNPVFSDYAQPSYRKDQLVKRIIEQIIEDKIPPLAEGNKLIDHMVFHGKKLYLMTKLLPSQSQKVIHEYSQENMDWCKKNELNIWAFLLEKELLYKSDKNTISWYSKPGPTSRNMPGDAPARAANFIGQKIVKAYMEKFPETSMKELLSITNGTEILQKSKYKPKKS